MCDTLISDAGQFRPQSKGNHMKTETFKGNIESAYGKPVSPALSFEGEFEAFETVTELKEKNEYPSEDEIVSFVNNKRKANKRQQVMTATLDAAGYEKPTLETDTDLQVKTIVKALMASGKHTEVTALAAAKASLGLS